MHMWLAPTPLLTPLDTCVNDNFYIDMSQFHL
jgi:hypothetical protein